MRVVDLVDLLGEDWSKRWVRFRAAVLLFLVLLFPGAVVKCVTWYAHEKATEMTTELRHVLSSLLPSSVPDVGHRGR